MERSTGVVRVKRLVAAHDCGLIVNPVGVKNQIEGNILQSLSRALKEEVQFDEARITSVDWGTYPILTFSDAPEMEIVLLDRPDQPALSQASLRCHRRTLAPDAVYAGAGTGGGA